MILMFCLTMFAMVILAANIFVYRLTVRENYETLRQLWAWEDYIREWVREEINHAAGSQIR